VSDRYSHNGNPDESERYSPNCSSESRISCRDASPPLSSLVRELSQPIGSLRATTGAGGGRVGVGRVMGERRATIPRSRNSAAHEPDGVVGVGCEDREDGGQEGEHQEMLVDCGGDGEEKGDGLEVGEEEEEGEEDGVLAQSDGAMWVSIAGTCRLWWTDDTNDALQTS